MRSLLFLLFFVFVAFPAFSQGCSDAGFCTMGAMRPDQKFHKKASVKLRSIELSHYYAYNRFGDEFFVYTLDANVAIGEKSQAQIKLPYMRVKGLIAETQGISDISLSFTHNLWHTEDWQLNASIGAKIPVGKPDNQWRGRDLPMYYQTTLGTYDAIIGASLISRNWLFATGLQQALNTTDNHFLLEEWEGTNWQSTAEGYAPSAGNLQRGTDVMRVERNFRSSKVNASLGVLTIWRLNKDVVDHPNGTSESKRGTLERTDGPAITGLATVGYHLTPRSSFKIVVDLSAEKDISIQMVLSREFVNTIGYEFKF